MSEDEEYDESSSSQYHIPCSMTKELNMENIIVFLEITSGYTFRQLIEFSKKAVEEFPMFFGKNYISTIRENGKETLVTSTVLRREDLTRYYINLNLASNKNKDDINNSYHVINMNLAEFHAQIKSLGKREGIRIFQYANSPDAYIQSFGGKSEGGFISIRTEPYKYRHYNIVEKDRRPSNNPNVTVPLSSFCTVVNAVTRLRYPTVTLQCFPNGAHLFSGNETNSTKRTSPWGDITPLYNGSNKPSNCFEINIDQTDLCALAKFANFHPEGIIRIYCSMDNIVRFEVPLGCYGLNTTYIYLKAR